MKTLFLVASLVLIMASSASAMPPMPMCPYGHGFPYWNGQFWVCP